MDPDFEGTEQEKNLKLAAADYVPKDDDVEDIPLPVPWVRLINASQVGRAARKADE